MAVKENAQRAAKGRREQSSSANTGPGWIESATEGREARRRRSNTEYAEQLRAQIAAQKGINQVQQRQRPGEVAWMEERTRGPEWQRSWSGNQDGQGGSEAEHSQRRVEGEQTMTPSQGQTHNSLAVER